MEALLRDKFRRNAKSREVLVSTGRVKLVYTNTHDDRVWGICGGGCAGGGGGVRREVTPTIARCDAVAVGYEYLDLAVRMQCLRFCVCFGVGISRQRTGRLLLS